MQKSKLDTRHLAEPVYDEKFLGESQMSTAEYSNVFEEHNQVSTTKLPPATELCKRSTEEQHVYLLNQRAGIYEGAENYGLLSKITGLTEDTIKTLAKGTADNLVIPVGSYVATKIVVPVGKHVAEEIVVPLGKYVAKDIVVPVGKYVAEEIAFPIAKEVASETKDITKALAVSLKDYMKDMIKEQMEEVKQEIKSMPNKIMEDIKKVLSPLKIWGAPTMEDADYYQQYSNEFML